MPNNACSYIKQQSALNLDLSHAMKILVNTAFIFSLLVSLLACSSVTPVNLLCNEQEVEIYVNEDYVGRGLVHYVVPAGCDYITVSCRNAGQELFSRRYYVKGKKNKLFELTVPRDYMYSTGGKIYTKQQK